MKNGAMDNQCLIGWALLGAMVLGSTGCFAYQPVQVTVTERDSLRALSNLLVAVQYAPAWKYLPVVPKAASGITAEDGAVSLPIARSTYGATTQLNIAGVSFTITKEHVQRGVILRTIRFDARLRPEQE